MTFDTAAPGTAPERKTAFDAAERARIRAALLRYMEEHRIGVPTLQVRIAKASGRSPDLIPLKTLQRFLADSHRTNDAFLIPVYEFTKEMPTTAPTDQFAAVATALAAFFPDGIAAPRSLPRRITSVMKTFRLVQPLDKEIFSGIISFERASTDGIVRIRERIYNPDAKPEFVLSRETENAAPVHTYEGVLVTYKAAHIGLMRNTLTRTPRLHLFAIDPGRMQMLSSCLFEKESFTTRFFPIEREMLALQSSTDKGPGP